MASTANNHDFIRWHGPFEPITFRSAVIQHPLTYACQSGTCDEPSAIEASLKVSAIGTLDPLGYWPNYATFTPRQRHEYLLWMAAGRSPRPSEIGYAFLFFYGLERRALHDQKDAELILNEVLRLRAEHIADNPRVSRSFLGYTKRFSLLLIAQNPAIWPESMVRPLFEAMQGGKDDIAVALSWSLMQHQHLPEWLAFAMGQATREGRTHHAPNMAKVLRQLFSQYYAEQWPQGLPLQTLPGAPQTEVSITHYAASAGLEHYEQVLALPSQLLKSLEAIVETYERCERELRPVTKLLSLAKPDDQPLNKLSLWNAFPTALRVGTHPSGPLLSAKFSQAQVQQMYAILPLSELVPLAGLPDRARYSAAQSTQLAEMVESCGFAIEPDPRIGGRAYTSEETVSVFLPLSEPIDIARYNAACLMLRLGLLATATDGKPDQAHLKLLAQHLLEVFGLSLSEQRRMMALANLLLSSGIDGVSTRALLQKLTSGQRESVGKLLLAIAAHDGTITQEEMKSLRAGFTRLGLNAVTLDSSLTELRVRDGLTVVQHTSRRRPGEKIPSEPIQSEVVKVHLDQDVIEALLRETQDVQQTLMRAMQTDSESDASNAQVANSESEKDELKASNSQNISSAETIIEVQQDEECEAVGFSERFRPLYMALLQREVWPLPEASALAREHGQMLSGALEAINEWSLESLGGQLFYEEDDCIIVEKELLNP